MGEVAPLVETLVSDVHEYMMKVLQRIVADSMSDFPKLVLGAQQEARRLLDDQYEKAHAYVKVFLASEKYITTLDDVGYGKVLEEVTNVIDQYHNVSQAVAGRAPNAT